MKRKYNRRAMALFTLLMLVMTGAGCRQDVAESGEAESGEAAAANADDPAPPTAGSKVAKIVFVGKERACDCTRKRVDDSFAALQNGLAERQDIPVERIRVDTDQAKVAQHQKMRAIMVLPAIYLLDGSGGLVDMLQGEVTEKQVRDAIR